MKRFGAAVLAVMLVVGAPVFAGVPPVLSLHEALPVGAPPAIDGRLEDACWQQLATHSVFYDLSRVDGGVTPLKTALQIGYDDQGVYLGVRLFETNMAGITATKTTRDDKDLWKDDCIEIYFNDTAPGSGFRKFTVNSLGTRREEQGGIKTEWNSEAWKAAAAKEDNAWTVEAFFPWNDLGASARTGDWMRFCLCRFSWPGSNTLVAATTSPGGNHHRSNRHGWLWFEKSAPPDIQALAERVQGAVPGDWLLLCGDKAVSIPGVSPKVTSLPEILAPLRNEIAAGVEEYRRKVGDRRRAESAGKIAGAVADMAVNGLDPVVFQANVAFLERIRRQLDDFKSGLSPALGQAIAMEDFSFASSLDGTAPLFATAFYPEHGEKLPLMVVQHGYWGTRQEVYASARQMSERGYFSLCLDIRGWEKAAGKHDDGGVEIMDIYDGIQAACQRYPDRIDGSRVSIAGYSNGGGNAFFSAVRFPYLFRGALACFGIPDYGMWITIFNGFRGCVVQAVGDTPEKNPEKYLARNACLAAGNLGPMRFHIAYDEQEPLCPIAMDDAFVKAAGEGGAKAVFVHTTKVSDWVRWFHGYNNDGNLTPLEDRFMDDLRDAPALPPVMPDKGELTVVGFLVTPRFTCVLGKGDNAAARLTYALGRKSAEFRLTPISTNLQASARITLLDPKPTEEVRVTVDSRQATVPAFPVRAQAAGTINSTITFRW